MSGSNEKFRLFIRNYWNYYKELEREFFETRRYVDFQIDNFMAYSVEYLKLFQAVCSEIDVIGKTIAFEFNDKFKPDDIGNNIYKWWYEVQGARYIEKYSDLGDCGVRLQDVEVYLLDEFAICPWNDFEVEKYRDSRGANRFRTVNGLGVPEWWKAYNKVKHSRTYQMKNKPDKQNYSMANLGNLINAYAGLYILEKVYMKRIGTQIDLEAFADFSLLFDKMSFATSADIDEDIKEIMGID